MTRAPAKPSFEVEGANRVLPLVRSIVTDIVANYVRLRELAKETRAAKAAPPADATPEAADARGRAIDALRAEAEERSARMEDYVHELSELGVDLKDPERGLVDFACERGGRTVLLCWELGEPSVAHWHGTDENYFDRRPLSSLPAMPDARSRTESGGSKRSSERGDAGPASK